MASLSLSSLRLPPSPALSRPTTAMFMKIWRASPHPSRVLSLSNHCISLTPAASPSRSASQQPNLSHAPSSVTSGGQTTITWNSTSSDPCACLIPASCRASAFPSTSTAHTHPHSFDGAQNNTFADGYTLQFLNVSDINQVYATTSTRCERHRRCGWERKCERSTTGGTGATGNGSGNVKPTSTAPSSSASGTAGFSSGSAPSTGYGAPSSAARAGTLPAAAAAIMALISAAFAL
ncbi:hypothetical protein DFH09DRAFT_1361276 [Mycena vulgaris]|nr:hypothetical protein DFH09DRAFT_1361276 [Mycena vulgaris]